MAYHHKGYAEAVRWMERGYKVPMYDRDAVMERTKENPYWIHFGYGNIFRAFQANVVQNLLNQGVLDRGLIAVAGTDSEVIDKLFRPRNNYSVLVTMKADGTQDRIVIGSIVESMTADRKYPEDIERLKEIFCKDSLQMVSFTITEKGYALTDAEGKYKKAVQADFENGPEQTQYYLGMAASLLYVRYKNGAKPIAMVSMDNCSHNGDKLHQAIQRYAQAWVDNGFVDSGFVDYINDGKRVSFPWTMIDKITPRPDPSIEEMLEKDMHDSAKGAYTSRNKYITPYVNAEEYECLVIEDWFPNGRPDLEKGGVIFTDRDTVDKVETMKVCTCLNPLHTTLAVFGCLLGYTSISEEMKNPILVELIKKVGYTEGLPVAVNPGIIDPKEFIDTVFEIRLPNPFISDSPQRIAADTSQKLSIRFGETIKAYQTSEELDVKELIYIPLVFAGWLRYLMGIDDSGNEFSLSPDPLLDMLRPYVSELRLGDSVEEEALRPVLENEDIFGVNLYEAEMADLVIRYLNEMLEGEGAVRSTLERML